MNTDTPTPRTDAAIEQHMNAGMTEGDWADLCRQLERELAAVTKERDEAKEQARGITALWAERHGQEQARAIKARGDAIKAQADLAAARAELAELAESVRPARSLNDNNDAATVSRIIAERDQLRAENAKLREAAESVYDRLHELGCFTDEQETLRAALEGGQP